MAFGWGTVASLGINLLGKTMSKKGKESGQESEFTAINRAMDRSAADRQAIERDAGTPFIEKPQDTLAAEVDAEGDVYENLHDLLGDTNWQRFAESIKGQVSPAVMAALRDDYLDDIMEQKRQVNKGSGELDADDYEEMGDVDYFEDEFEKDDDVLKFFHGLSDYT